MPGNSKVLIASSEPANRHALETLVFECGFESVVCATLEEACTVAERGNIPLGFCDAQLPDGGYHNLLALAMVRGFPLVVVPRTPDTRQYLEAMQLGAFDMIASPVRRGDVERIVWNVLRRPVERAVSPGSLRRSAATG